MSSIVLASGNAGKIREIQAILQNDHILPQSQFKVVEPDETGATFIENAIIKARNAAAHCNLPAIADDSGLAVDVLGGAPGVISARYAGAGASDQANLDKLLEEMRDVPDTERGARFICVMVYLRHALDPTPIIAQGVWKGRILRQAVGENGFGYDPVFWVEQYQCSSAQLAPELKNALSHRGQALRALSQQLVGL
ncbi:RdgB/HAM1 family non-canonical purine NTP pyrophosphatase [Methylomonas albis]|uniref:dITP/XTP pyrophosphatase n=1 Tax=Methylomonas albis TaxID=1854563 RepID=A0ABR9CU91_9GAMM|nr:RdgB/HAM1 family non-canonical purine NTP pyrophosphatase [Methylomonas albis]MBD9354319.1 RdgB/HAM1 family non-canonical purine NTP pyrophosphatase [Methylomonas albis]